MRLKIVSMSVSVEDKLIKEVLMSGFQADETTCCEPKLRYLLQQKTQLVDQWKFGRHELLRFLRANVEKLARYDIEELVQLPEEDSESNLNDIEEEDNEDTHSTDEDVQAEAPQPTAEPNHPLKPQYTPDATPQQAPPPQYKSPTATPPITNTRPAMATLAAFNLSQATTSSHPRPPTTIVAPQSYSDGPALPSSAPSRHPHNLSPLASPQGSAVGNTSLQIQRLNARVMQLDNYVRDELAAIKRELESLKMAS